MHRDLLGAHRIGALHLPPDAAEQRMQPERNRRARAKRLVHIAVNEGVLTADEAMGEIQKPIWASEDLKIRLASFRANGPGLAKFTGR